MIAKSHFLPTVKTSQELTHSIENKILSNSGAWIVTINLDIHRQLCANPSSHLAQTIESEALKTADGFPMKIISSHVFHSSFQRVTGADYALELATISARNQIPLIVAGGKIGDSGLVSSRLQALITGIQVHPIELSFGDSDLLFSQLRNEIKIDRFTLLLGVGALKSEEVILGLRELFPNSIYIGCGAGVSYLAGTLKRAPKIFIFFNLEWFWRLVTEPKRLFKRYIVQDLPHLAKIIFSSI